jgi:LAO/AO transport system kinase
LSFINLYKKSGHCAPENIFSESGGKITPWVQLDKKFLSLPRPWKTAERAPGYRFLLRQSITQYIWVSMNIQEKHRTEVKSLAESIQAGNAKALARAISLVENASAGYREILQALQIPAQANVIGITGPPGAGKSTLADGLTALLVAGGKRMAILCVDPSSPFHHGALLGDRIRMNEWFSHPGVFIRSLSSRGSLGGLHPQIIEITDVLKAARFDYILIETVGVGQSEVEIAGLADTTVVVLVPEGGDEIQTMKSGLMEIADIFVVNKADRPEADRFVKNLRLMLTPAFHKDHRPIPVLKTIATRKEGLDGLAEEIKVRLHTPARPDRGFLLLAEKAWQLIGHQRMKDVSRAELEEKIREQVNSGRFNLYRFVSDY